ncbi:MAG: 30S ribosome-binding factor RbfA [Candidatus Hydrogenedentota bacterium]|nr:MAG: 30S ribosome-binding factor RbfA [Candidatus Hydrogenedentota bacterium]
MSGSRRLKRVDQLIREEIAKAIQKDLSDPRLGFVTVLGAKTRPDLSQTVVRVSVMGNLDQREASLAALRSAEGYLRNLIKPHLRLRFIPEIHFELDDTFDRLERVSELLAEGVREEPAGE